MVLTDVGMDIEEREVQERKEASRMVLTEVGMEIEAREVQE